MMLSIKSAGKTSTGEEGFVLLGVLFMVVVLLIWLAVAAPKVATEIRRDKELELYHRGMQYTRAIRLYYKKFGRYPTSLDLLENSNNLRFLRKRYNDPLTGKPDWRLIHVGEARVQQTGLFGQPTGVAGAGGSAGGSSSLIGGSSSAIGGFSSASGGSSSLSPTDPTSGTASGGTAPSGSGSSPTGSGTGGPTGLGTSSLTSSSGSPIGSAGPIVGVASSVKKESIREYKKQKHYNEWEFVYNPQADMGGLGGNNGTGILNQSGTNPTNGLVPSLGGGSSPGGGSPGGSSPGGGTGSPPTGNSPGSPSNPNPPTPNQPSGSSKGKMASHTARPFPIPEAWLRR